MDLICGFFSWEHQEVEEKEHLVRHMWDIYTHSSSTKLPRFWQEAFEAAYEALASDVAAIRDAAVSEIAKLSLRSFNPDPFPVQPTPVSHQNSLCLAYLLNY